MKFEELNLDAQKKHNLIIKELNTLSTKHDSDSLARKQELANQYEELMGHSMGELSSQVRQVIEEKREVRREAQQKRWNRREATHPK